MKQETLKAPAIFGWRLQTSPALLGLAALPIAVILVFVAVMIWVSFQRGLLGTASAAYTLENYRAIFTDPFLFRVLWNTAVFTVATTLVALAIGLPIAWLAE
jgi:ABC-type spermidine/putrescine transport system permease subunit I